MNGRVTTRLHDFIFAYECPLELIIMIDIALHNVYKKKKQIQLKAPAPAPSRSGSAAVSVRYSSHCRIETERCVSSSVLGEYKIYPVIRDWSNHA